MFECNARPKNGRLDSIGVGQLRYLNGTARIYYLLVFKVKLYCFVRRWSTKFDFGGYENIRHFASYILFNVQCYVRCPNSSWRRNVRALILCAERKFDNKSYFAVFLE